MKKLPKWCITDHFPALYDTESATAIEMVAKLYGSMNELIDDYNAFVDRVNAEIEAFEQSINKDIENFKVAIRQEFQDFIDTVELKIMAQDKAIADKFAEQDEKLDNAIEFMKFNLETYLESVLQEMKTNGEMAELIEPIVVETVHEIVKPNGIHTEYEILWQNQTPNEVFAGQEIIIMEETKNKYDEFLITYKFRNDSAYDQFYIYLKNKGQNISEYITGTAGGYVSGGMLEYVYVDDVLTPLRRLAYISTNGITFDECRTVRANSLEQIFLNEGLIPCKIYGVKRFAYVDDLSDNLNELAGLIGGGT